MTHSYVSVLLCLLAPPFALKSFVSVELFLHVGLGLLILQDNRMGEMGNMILIVMIWRMTPQILVMKYHTFKGLMMLQMTPMEQRKK